MKTEKYTSENIRYLATRIETNLKFHGQKMIGVFGINSDDVVKEALRNVDKPYRFLGQFNTDENPDVFTLFASRVMNYAKQIYERQGMTERQKNMLLRKLANFTGEVNDDDPYLSQLDKLDRIATRSFRNNYSKECLELLKEIEGIENTKYILSVEIGLGGFNYDVLQKLKDIDSPDLLIVVNSLRSIELESATLDESVGVNSSYSRDLVWRYFASTDTINCN